MNEVEVRRAAATDVVAIRALELETFGVDAWSEHSVEQELTAEGRRALVALDAERLLGYAVARTVGDVADLHRVVVAAPARRRGLGRRLLEELASDAVRQGADRVLLEVSRANDAALACYRSSGFVEVDHRPAYYRDGTDALVLQLDLTDDATANPTKEEP